MVPDKNHMIGACNREFMPSSIIYNHLYSYSLRVVRVGQFILLEVYGHRSGFTSFNRKLYGHGIQFFLCVFWALR